MIEIDLPTFIFFIVVGLCAILSTISLMAIAGTHVDNSKVTNERIEAIESMNRVQQLQLNDLMYPGEYNGVH